MKKISTLIFLLIITCIFLDKSVNKIYDNFEVHFTNADILNIRTKPSLSSKIINQIPFGSKINTSNTNIMETYENKLNSWHFVKEANGFVLDSFLQKNETDLARKKMILKSSYSYNRCNLYGLEIYKTIELYNNTAYFTDEFIDFDFGKKRIFLGNYQIENDSILINVVEQELQNISYADETSNITEKIKTKEKKISNLNLIWKESIKGFITNDQVKYLESTTYNVDIKKCIFTSKNCIDYDPSKKKCSEKYENSDICDQIGYFCKR
ncbi:SH3 domain-containing protein [Leptospira sp. GIMC2001]|uniref:SH3 domain-containing protein n=1 Tax=Leptospira sp. GIMC2001 TaxID=1513297 RepID=UPI00234BBB52|nr:SH3 domain-containing protein [Leptospira sp. GIMC2001]WCL50793.1 SH3 domain-containing protein [Leptospira sp. GIMC2001]WCL50826.1 SH3 domain-containing protein [Leptospira sp. GIMC2001]